MNLDSDSGRLDAVCDGQAQGESSTKVDVAWTYKRHEHVSKTNRCDDFLCLSSFAALLLESFERRRLDPVVAFVSHFRHHAMQSATQSGPSNADSPCSRSVVLYIVMPLRYLSQPPWGLQATTGKGGWFQCSASQI